MSPTPAAAHPTVSQDAAAAEPATFTRRSLMTADEVAGVLRVKRSTALDYMRRGLIPAFKIGRNWYSLRSHLDQHLTSVVDQPPS